MTSINSKNIKIQKGMPSVMEFPIKFIVWFQVCYVLMVQFGFSGSSHILKQKYFQNLLQINKKNEK